MNITKLILIGITTLALTACGGGGSKSSGNGNGPSEGTSGNFNIITQGELPILANVDDMGVEKFTNYSNQPLKVFRALASPDNKKLYLLISEDSTSIDGKLLEYDLENKRFNKPSKAYALDMHHRSVFKVFATKDNKIGFFLGSRYLNIVDLGKFKHASKEPLPGGVDAVLSEDEKYLYILSFNYDSKQSSINVYDVSEITKKDRTKGSLTYKKVSTYTAKVSWEKIDISKDGNVLFTDTDILDVTDKKQIKSVYKFSDSANSFASKKGNNLIYRFTLDDMSIYDVSDIYNPKKKKQIDGLGDLNVISSDRNTMITSSSSYGDHIFDLSDVFHPQIIRAYLPVIDRPLRDTPMFVTSGEKMAGYTYSFKTGNIRYFSPEVLKDKKYVAKIPKNYEKKFGIFFMMEKNNDTALDVEVKMDNSEVLKDAFASTNDLVFFHDEQVHKLMELEYEVLLNAMGKVNFDIAVNNGGKTYKGKTSLEVYENDRY